MIMCNAFYLLEKMFICLFFLKNELYVGEFEIIESKGSIFYLFFNICIVICTQPPKITLQVANE